MLNSTIPYRIYQQRSRGEFRFEDLESGLYTEQTMQENPEKFPYTEMYSGQIEEQGALGKISYRFNAERPADFKGHSLSVSDIVTLGDKGFLCSGFSSETGWRELVPETLKSLGIKTGAIAEGKGHQFRLALDIPDGAWEENRLEVAGILRRLAARLNMDVESHGDVLTRTDGNIVGSWERTDSVEEKKIYSSWSTDDVKSIRPTLTVDEAMDVLETALANHDANIGINWDVLQTHMKDLFPSDRETAFICKVKEQLMLFGYDAALLVEANEACEGGEIDCLEYVFSVSKEKKFMEHEDSEVKVVSGDGVLFEVFQQTENGYNLMLGTILMEEEKYQV